MRKTDCKPPQKKMPPKLRRVVVLAVPPVDELDFGGPIQVISAANRLAGKRVYGVEVATNGKDLKVQGEGGLFSFLAETNYKDLNKNL
jgi:transcriptional regulator GlxA family with amidase domain